MSRDFHLCQRDFCYLRNTPVVVLEMEHRNIEPVEKRKKEQDSAINFGIIHKITRIRQCYQCLGHI